MVFQNYKHKMIFNSYGDKNLVILCAGDNPVPDFFKDHDKRKYDLLVIYYGDNPENFKNKFKNFNYFHHIKGYKFHIIKKYYYENIKFFKKYRYVFMPDDDIILSPKDINNFFRILNEFKLVLAQPSLIGYYSHLITLHKFENVLRYTNFVEIMMPCFLSDVLAKCISSFDSSLIGHGLDYLWPKMLSYPDKKIAIIDEVVAVHSRKVGSGSLYSNNNHINEAFEKFMIKNQLSSGVQNVLGHIPKENYNKQSFDDKYYPFSESFKLMIEKYI